MNTKEVIDNLDLKVVTKIPGQAQEVTGGFTGDLLSVVMGQAQEGNVWVTIQSHINIVAVASLVNVSLVIVAEGFSIDPDAISKAEEEEVILCESPLSSYDLCKKLGALDI